MRARLPNRRQELRCSILFVRRSGQRVGGHNARASFSLLIVALSLSAAAWASPQSPPQSPLPSQPNPTPQSVPLAPVVIDRVLARVDQRVILASEIKDEIRLSVLDPNRVGQGVLTPQGALDQLISRALIEQQISQEDAEAAVPSQKDMDARLEDLRKQLPACVHENCASDAGWKAFLTAHGLTPARVDAYLTYRVEILRFIETRFRPSIRIAEPEIENYYRNTLLPQYAPGEAVPTLEQVSARIEEILLQQQVNILFDQWLTNLRRQGDVEVLDQDLEDPDAHGAPLGTQGGAVDSAPGAVKP